jgi:hypothetical protein
LCDSVLKSTESLNKSRGAVNTHINASSDAITRINNALPLFPGGTNTPKFSDAEVVGLLEWCLPPSWRTKFDLDSYVPTLDSKAKLIESCEAIERNQEDASNAKATHKDKNRKPKNP